MARKAFSFSIRDLFWLTMVVAMGLGWWLDRGRLAGNHDRLQSEMERAAAERIVLKGEIAALQEYLRKNPGSP